MLASSALCVLSASAAFAGTAAAVAAPAHITINVPRENKVGIPVHIHFSGRTEPGFTQLAVIITNMHCATTLAEARRRGGRPHLFDGLSASVTFRERLSIKHSTPGSHYVCAYLADPANGDTLTLFSVLYHVTK